MRASRPSKKLSGASKSMATRQGGGCQGIGQGARVRRDCREEGERGGTRYRREGQIAGECDPWKGAARRQDGHNCDQSSRRVRIGEHLFAREEIRPSGRRLQGFGSSLPSAVTIGGSWFRPFARET